MDQLPIEFQALAGKVDYVRKVSENEWHSSCPNCGGEIHPEDGSFPDRFIMWRVSRNGTPFGMCVRKCGYKWSPNKEDAKWTPEERAEFAIKQAQMEIEWMKAESERIQQLSELVESQLIWKNCHDGMTEADRQYYEKQRFIPRSWQDSFFLGVMQNYTVRNHLTTYKSKAYTVPMFGLENSIENITLRIANPIDSNDRYRRLYSSKAQHLYNPERRKANKVVLMEGEFKAQIGVIYGWLPDDHVIYGVQSKSPERRILKMLDFAEVVYLAFDPDAYIPDPKSGRVAVVEAAKQIGMERVRYVVPPSNYKFDDAILRGYKFRNGINMAVRSLL